MSTALAPRPANEERRANAVISTGLIDSPEPELFQIYCDLARDISGFEKASFSLFDHENQCEIADNGYEESQVGQKSERDEFNVCAHVLLNSEPLIMEDISKDPVWMNHPRVLDGTGTLGYAGFPVINKDNFALGTLCLLNKAPMSIDKNKIILMKKITANIALLLDLRIEQKLITAEKILQAVSRFSKFNSDMNIEDLKVFMSIISNINVDHEHSKKLLSLGLCEKNGKRVELSFTGRNLLANMNLRVKPMKKIKLQGSQAENLIDEMFAELN